MHAVTRHLLAAALLLKCVEAAACPLCMGWGQPSKAQQLVFTRQAVLAVPTEEAGRFRVVQVIKGGATGGRHGRGRVSTLRSRSS
jgi:hypothetical protein